MLGFAVVADVQCDLLKLKQTILDISFFPALLQLKSPPSAGDHVSNCPQCIESEKMMLVTSVGSNQLQK